LVEADCKSDDELEADAADEEVDFVKVEGGRLIESKLAIPSNERNLFTLGSTVVEFCSSKVGGGGSVASGIEGIPDTEKRGGKLGGNAATTPAIIVELGGFKGNEGGKPAGTVIGGAFGATEVALLVENIGEGNETTGARVRETGFAESASRFALNSAGMSHVVSFVTLL
jgi:hypothetical protein